jgi:ribose transport system permease protein
MSNVKVKVAGSETRPTLMLRVGPEVLLLALIVATCILFGTLNENFLTFASLKILLLSIVFTGIILIGQSLLIIGGEFDLSVGAIASLGSVSTAILLADYGMNFAAAIIVGCIIGAGVGLLNGVITVIVGIPAFVTTLAMLFMVRGFGYVLTGGDPVYPLPGNPEVLSKTVIFGLVSSVWIFLILFLIADLYVRNSATGRKIYLVGGNPVAARMSGIRVRRVKIGLFMFTGVLSAFSGILLMSRSERADNVTGLGWELAVIAAAAVGGIRLEGGHGTLTGAFLGLIFLQVILQGLTTIGANAMLMDAIKGIVMISAVWLAFRKTNQT